MIEDKSNDPEDKSGSEFEGTVKSAVIDVPGMDMMTSVAPEKTEEKVLPSVKAQGIPLPTVDEKQRVVYNADGQAKVTDLQKQEEKKQ